MPESEWLLGFVIGVLMAGLFGYIAQQLRFARNQISAFSRPQSVGHKTDKTPADVFSGCITGAIAYIIWLFILFAVVTGLGVLAFQMISR